MKYVLVSMVISVVVMLITSSVLFAQADLQQAQYLFNKIYINPAFAGTEGKVNANVFYQLNSSNAGASADSYNIAAAVDGLFPGEHSAYGVNLVRSRFGNDSYTTAYANYAYHLKLTEDLDLSSGLGMGFHQFDIDLSQLQSVTVGDPAAGNSVYSSKLDARAGIRMVFKSAFYAGVSFDNLLSVYSNKDDFKEDFPPAFRKINLYTVVGANIKLSYGNTFKPSFLFMKTFGGATAIELNALHDYANTFAFGLSLRREIRPLNSVNTNDHSVQSILRPLLQYNVSKKNNLKFAYCYSFNAGRPSGVSKGSHDLSVVFNVPRTEK